ncbi:MAG: hybrid sensor histidine kinase/response regulator [Bacteriovoracaceae bacterium]|nr:hybrid sensor histidine kinase/response regulator [Bacteriovoracaceae bacterium]
MGFLKHPLYWFLGAIGILIASDIIDVVSTFRANNVVQERRLIREGTIVLKRFSLDIRNAEYSAKNYLITGKVEDLQPFLDSEKKAELKLSKIRNDLPIFAADSETLNSIESLLERNMRLLHGQVEARQYRGLLPALALASENTQTLISKEIENKIRQLETRLEGLLVGRRHENEQITLFSERAIVGGTFLDIFIFSWIFFTLRREIQRRRKVENQLSVSLHELGASNRSLKESSRVRDQFLTIAAHDLRSPLRQIGMFSELLSQEQNLSPENKETIDLIKSGADRMSALVEDLLQEASLRDGSFKLNKEKLFLKKCIPGVVVHYEAKLKQKKQTLKISPVLSYLLVEVDEIKFCQILDNLITNAIKYSPIGGHIWISAEADQSWVRIKVKDDGLGLEPLEMEKIFVPFFRAKAPTDGEPSTGLGLSIARSLTELHEGRLFAESDGLGCGSTFTIELPRVHENVVRLVG